LEIIASRKETNICAEGWGGFRQVNGLGRKENHRPRIRKYRPIPREGE
jgi:hypothetical protein